MFAQARSGHEATRTADPLALRAWVTEWIEMLVKLYDLDITLPRRGHRANTPAEIGYRIERTVDRVTKHLNATDRPSRGACSDKGGGKSISNKLHGRTK
jgi:hypothetical protein